MSVIKIAAIIPARMASSRFPGKPLLSIEGLPMIEHVRRRTLLCGDFSDVVVATCDLEIESVVKDYGGKVIMTATTHKVATERIIETMKSLDCTHVVNVQGDEILLVPSDVSHMTQAILQSPETPVWNAISKVEEEEELGDTNVVKCVVSKSGRLLFCSRDFSHFAEKHSHFDPFYKVLGILGYTRAFLESFVQYEMTPLEKIESIEQSRILENDILLQGVYFDKGYPGINTPEEAKKVMQILKQDPLQQAILREIL